MPIRRLINLLVKVVDLVDEPANQVPFLVVKSKEGTVDHVEGAVWTTAEVNNLPDTAFLLVSPGGEKDGEGKTVPRSLRHLPYRDKNGKVDLPHLRNALARIPQMKGVDESTKKRLTEHAQSLLEKEGGGSKKEKSMSETADTVATSAANEALSKAMAAADSVLGAGDSLAKSLGDAVQSAIESIVLSKTMTPDNACRAMKAASDLIQAAAKEPDEEMRTAALGKAQSLVDRFHKSVTSMQPGPQVPNPTGAGGEPWNGSNKPEGNLRPQFTAKEFTAGTGPSGNKTIPSEVEATPPEGSPTGTPKPKVTSFPGGSDITDAVRKAAEELTKALEGLTKSMTPPLEKKQEAVEPPLEKKQEAVEPPLEKKQEAVGTVGPQGSSQPPADEITKAVTKALTPLADRLAKLEQGNVGSGTKAAPEAGTEGDAVEKSKNDSFWKGVISS